MLDERRGFACGSASKGTPRTGGGGKVRRMNTLLDTRRPEDRGSEAVAFVRTQRTLLGLTEARRANAFRPHDRLRHARSNLSMFYLRSWKQESNQESNRFLKESS